MDAVTRYSVASIRDGSRPSLSAQGLLAQRQLVRQRSSPEPRNVQRAVVSDQSPRSRSSSEGGLPPEVLPWKGTFEGGRVTPNVLPAGTKIFRYHSGTVGKPFWTTVQFESPAEAAYRLGMPDVPTHRSELVLEKPIPIYEGTASAFPGGLRAGGRREWGRPGRAHQIFIVKTVLEALLKDQKPVESALQ